MNIVVISGTSRPNNYTAHAAQALTEQLRELGLTVTFIDGRETQLAFPGEPPTDDAEKLSRAVNAADAVVLATPEYHGSFSAYMKLVIESMGFPNPLKGKPVALLGVAAGRIGAIKSLEMLRSVCAHVGAFVLPGALSIAGVDKVFSADGTCTDEGTGAQLARSAAALHQYLLDRTCPEHELESDVREKDGATMRV